MKAVRAADLFAQSPAEQREPAERRVENLAKGGMDTQWLLH